MTVWSPIAGPESSLAGRARDALTNITEELLQSRECALESSLFFAYKARADGDRRWKEAAAERLNIAIRGAESMWSTRRFGLFGGLAGLGFAIEQVARCLNVSRQSPEAVPAGGDINRDTDAALLLELQRGRWQGDPYLASGLAGIGVYFLERLPLRSAMEGLELVIAQIGDRLRRADCADSPDVANGFWGIAHFLMRAMDAGIDVVRTRSILETVDRRLNETVTKAEPAAWDGSLGIAAICFQMGRLELGRTLVKRSLLREPLAADPCDAEVVHSWNRVRSLYPDSVCHRAAVESLDRMLTVHKRPATGGKGRGAKFFAVPAVAGLVLMAAVTHTEPEWDRIVCLSGS